jgi:peptidoglycan/LPS O-acetylase OafA/YrhL
MSGVAHRREIDGLRAVAVVPVVLFHAGAEWLSGGFVGVDVFFVISGYLITSILLNDAATGQWSLLGFYERRARRILPALFLVLASCLPFAWMWLLPAEMDSFCRSLVAVCLFVSNFFFNATSGHVETGTDLQPLLHTWSLGVAGQFYVVFPLALLAIFKLRKTWLLPAVSLAALGSLALAQWGVKWHLGFTYFLLPTRAWELLLGSLAAIWLQRRLLLGREEGAARPHADQALSLLGLLMIGTAAVAFSRETPFPSVHALLPTLGAVLVILFAQPQTLVGRVLGSTPCVGIGLVSYSAYLWHQPLFAFARHRSIDLPASDLMFGLAALSFVLAFFSWRFVETPFRQKAAISRNAVFSVATAGTAFFVLFGLGGALTQGYVKRQPFFADVVLTGTVADSRCHNGQRRTAGQIASGNVCMLGRTGSTAQPTFAVIGDSHAGALFETLGEAARQRGLVFQAVSGGFCAPLLNGFRLNREQDVDCQALTRAAFDSVVYNPAIRDVVLVAEWAVYTSGQRDHGQGAMSLAALAADKQGTAASAAHNPAVFSRALASTAKQLAQAGKRLFIVMPPPEHTRQVLPTVAKQLLFEGRVQAPTVSTAAYLARNAAVIDAFNQVPGAHVIAVQDLFCDAALCASASSDGKAWYSDTNHLTEHGARRVAGRVMQHLLQRR